MGGLKLEMSFLFAGGKQSPRYCTRVFSDLARDLKRLGFKSSNPTIAAPRHEFIFETDIDKAEGTATITLIGRTEKQPLTGAFAGSALKIRFNLPAETNSVVNVSTYKKARIEATDDTPAAQSAPFVIKAEVAQESVACETPTALAEAITAWVKQNTPFRPRQPQ